MCIASGLGLLLEPEGRAFFDEPVGQYLVEFEGEEQRPGGAGVRAGGAVAFRRLARHAVAGTGASPRPGGGAGDGGRVDVRVAWDAGLVTAGARERLVHGWGLIGS